MNSLTRALARIVHSSSQSATTRKWAILQQFYSTTASGSSRSSKKTAYTLAKTPPKSAPQPSSVKEWERPSEIPYQGKVENSVNLIGYVDQAIQFEASSDGKYWAGTIISQCSSSSSSSLWIPIIFEGDLAHIAAFHLKKNDHIHIAGQLFVDPPHSSLGHGQVNVQVMVHSLNYIQGSSQVKEDSTPQRQEEDGWVSQLPDKSNKSYTTHDHGTVQQASMKKDGDAALGSWGDLLENPKDWWDYRDDKRDGLVKPKYPDFKHKDGSIALWLNTAPNSILSKLEGVEFDVKNFKSKQAKQHKGVESDVKNFKSKQANQRKGDESWMDLVENPDNWWDNRLNKKNEKGPDFKHKETGVVLWLSDSPTWVLPKLPSPKSKQASTFGEKSRQLS